jgi:Ring finger domain
MDITDYRNLPPGLHRRLLYSQTLSNTLSVSGLRLSLSDYRELEPLIEHDNFTYENLSLLQPVKNGLISKKLLRHSLITTDFISFCVICQETCDLSSIIRVLSCKHSFHINCIDEWFTENKTCPVCKFELH